MEREFEEERNDSNETQMNHRSGDEQKTDESLLYQWEGREGGERKGEREMERRKGKGRARRGEGKVKKDRECPSFDNRATRPNGAGIGTSGSAGLNSLGQWGLMA